MISKSAYIDNMILHHPKHGNLHPIDQNIQISQSWIVSQYKGEYPCINTVDIYIYLKVPNLWMSSLRKSEDHYPVGGAINLCKVINKILEMIL